MFATMTMTTGAVQEDTYWKHDIARSGIYPEDFNIAVNQSFQTINFTCGIDGGNEYDYVKIADIDGVTTTNELLFLCQADTGNVKDHILLLDESFSTLSIKDIDPVAPFTITTAISASDIIDIQGDSTPELIILLFDGANDYAQLGIYNLSGSSITYDRSISLSNTTSQNLTITGGENIRIASTSGRETSMICLDDYCLINYEQGIFSINMTTDSFNWGFYNTTLDIQDEPYDTNSLIFDIDHDGDDEIILQDYDLHLIYILSLSDGTIEATYDLSSDITTGSSFSIVECTDSQCASGYAEILIGDTDDRDCNLYKIDTYIDGGALTKVHDTVNDDGGSEYITCWLEDRDNDGKVEVCNAGLDVSTDINTGHVRCEEIDIFALDTLDFEIDGWGSLPISYQNQGSHTPAIMDISNDGLYDIVYPSFMLDFEETDGSDIIPYTWVTENQSQDAGQSPFILESSSNEMMIISRNAALDLIFISSTGSIDNITINDQIRFRDDGSFVPPYTKTWYDLSEQQFYYNGTAYLPENMSAICSNETSIDWTCDYSSGCLLDTEVDDYKIVMDCFGDGSQIIETGYHFNSQQVDLSCNPQYIDDGEYTMTMWITDAEHDISNNITISVDFIINDSICISYDSDDTLPEILSAPTASSDSPYCGSGTGELVLYNCSENNCFNDTDGDDIYTILVDCDGDGAYESTSSSDDRHMFWCTYDDISVTKTYFKIYTTGDTSQGVTGIIPVVVTESDVICQSDIPRLNGVSTNDTEPFCIGEIVSFFMTENVDYINPIAGSSELYIDCDGDDIYDEYSYDDGFPSIGYHQFDCLIGGNGSSIAMNMINRDGSSNELVYLYSSDTNSCIGQDEELSDQEKLIGELTGASIAWRSFIGLILIIAVMVGVAQMGIQSPFILGGSGIIMGVALTFLGLLPGYIMISLGVLAALTLGGFIFFAKGQTA